MSKEAKFEWPKFKKGWMKGDRINFYYLPDEHRVQYAEPSKSKKYIELVPKEGI